jgi:hypothetical protein
MENYVDITEIVKKLDKLYYEKYGYSCYGKMICKICGVEKDLGEFDPYITGKAKDVCILCSDQIDLKRRLVAKLKTELTESMQLIDLKKYSKKLQQSKNYINDITEEYSDECKYGVKLKYKEKEDVSYPVPEEYYVCNGRKTDWLGKQISEYDICPNYSICKKRLKLREKILAKRKEIFYGEHDRINNIIESVITDEVVKFGVTMLRLQRKIKSLTKNKNYETS